VEFSSYQSSENDLGIPQINDKANLVPTKMKSPEKIYKKKLKWKDCVKFGEQL
jgi:hypothetical protein